MSVTTQNTVLPYKVKDINLADWGRKEILLAEADILRYVLPSTALMRRIPHEVT